MKKTILLTGCTTGIGKETAIALAKEGSNLILLSRNEQKLKELQSMLVAKYHNKNIHYYACDFEDLKQVVSVAKHIAAKYSHLDTLINNAVIWKKQKSTSTDEFEMTWTVNYFAPFLLTFHLRKLMLKTAKETKDVRIINLSSEAHRFGKIDFNNLFAFDFRGTYGATKLANMLYTFKMARILNGFGVTSNCVHPGVVATGLWRELPKFIAWILDKFLISPAEGAKTTLFLANQPQLKENGLYWANMKVAKPSKAALDEKLQDELYEKTKVMLKKYLV
jgi:NAD(P)-dependent dehydrogenase (short-subunit alcohol dehydrogenase family)